MKLERVGVALVVAALVAPPLYVGLRALAVPGAILVTALALAAGVAWWVRRLPAALDGAARRRPALAALWLLLGVVAAVQMTRLGIFMADGTRRQQSMLPLYDTIAEHSCLSAYHRAAELSRREAPDLYEPGHYRGKIGAFKAEIYEYPPPFLPLPRLLGAATGHDFFRLRALWFPVLALPLLLAMGLVARGRPPSAALLAPAVLASMPTMLSLQYGNFHLAALALAVLGMLALRAPGRWPIAGGALLSFAALAKIFPGLLLIPLIVERRWRALAWVGAWLLGWTLLSIVVLGPAPLVAFFQTQLGRVASGAAFPFLVENERVIAANMSVHALVWKIGLLAGHPSAALARVAGFVYAAALIAGVALAARRRAGDVRLWLAALFLGALCSPFAPNPYAPVALLWLLSLLVAGAGRARVAWLASAWLAASVMVYALPLHAGPTLVALSLLAQLLGLSIAVRALTPTPG